MQFQPSFSLSLCFTTLLAVVLDVVVVLVHVMVMVVGIMEQVATKEVIVVGQLTDIVEETLHKVTTLVVEEVE